MDQQTPKVSPSALAAGEKFKREAIARQEQMPSYEALSEAFPGRCERVEDDAGNFIGYNIRYMDAADRKKLNEMLQGVRNVELEKSQRLSAETPSVKLYGPNGVEVYPEEHADAAARKRGLHAVPWSAIVGPHFSKGSE